MKTQTNKIQPIVLLVFALMLSMPIRGQDKDDGFLSGGAKVLGNITLSNNGTKSGFGYGAGAFVNLNVLPFMSVRGEALYVSHAARLDSYHQSIPGGSVDFNKRNIRFHTLEIPILLQFPLPILESMNPKVYAGGSYSYNFAVYEINDRIYNFKNPEITYSYYKYGDNVSSNFQSYNASIIGGLALSFDAIQVDVRYQQGVPNLINSNNNLGLIPYPSNYKSQILTISVGYKLF